MAKATDVALRLILQRGEVYRLPEISRGIRVRAGQAWLTHHGCDIVLKRGESLYFSTAEDFGVISPLGRAPMILEVLGCDRPPSSSSTRSVLNFKPNA